jgi:signal transduction histidine kinase
MTLMPIPFILTSITYLTLGIWIIFKHKNKAQRLYGALCITTACWQGVWAVLFSGLNENVLYLGLKFGYTGIVFIPAVFCHFIVEFTQRDKNSFWLKGAYLVSTCFVFLIWLTNTFISGFNQYSWGLAAKAGYIHPLFLVFVGIMLVKMFSLLISEKNSLETQKLKRRQTNWVLGALVIYSAGSLDLASNYGFPVFPLSSIFTGIAFILFTYAIFRYELLAIALQSENAEDKRRRLNASEEMKRMGMTTAFPLVSQGEVLGYLLLGEKMSEEEYSKEDLLLLRIIANQAALAYQRVRYLEMAVRGARTEMLGEIAGGFAHEIKTPLANISLPAELCFIDLTDVEQGKRTIQDVLPELKQRMKDIMQQTFKASDKIEAIRQFSKPGQIQLESVEITKILKNSISLLDHLLNKLAIEIKINFPERINPVRGNAKQLEIVFVNLIKNASEAMANSGSPAFARHLSLMGREEDNWIIISVKDSGPGIKRTDIGHLFEAYFTTKGSSGTGMGLFLSHQVVKAHGGSIEVQSEEGKGTEFIVRLPKYVDGRRDDVHRAA